MEIKTVKSTIQMRRDTAANWETNNPILAEGEMGYDTTNCQIRIGNGESNWLDLVPYVTRDSVIDLILDNYLAREIIAEWMETQKWQMVDEALQPFIDGTYYFFGFENIGHKLTIDLELGQPLSSIDLSAYQVHYALTVNDEPEIVSGTLSFDDPDYIPNEVGEYIPNVTFVSEKKIMGKNEHSLKYNVIINVVAPTQE